MRHPFAATSQRVIQAALILRDSIGELQFSPPVACVYNPLDYAWNAHREYLRRYASGPKRVLFLGMNPGPFGMVQTGVPFGEIAAVRDWLGIQEQARKPACQHPRRPVLGFNCTRSEISGRRLWGLFARRFGTAELFFSEHLVLNYCPLAFVESTGRNRTPDKLPELERTGLFEACDKHLRRMAAVLQPEWLVAIGEFAARRAVQIFSTHELKIGKILHPSPASPAANRNWPAMATSQLLQQGIWR